MTVLKSGKNAGCFVYYFQIGFQCDGYFNNVIETANENSVENNGNISVCAERWNIPTFTLAVRAAYIWKESSKPGLWQVA